MSLGGDLGAMLRGGLLGVLVAAVLAWWPARLITPSPEPRRRPTGRLGRLGRRQALRVGGALAGGLVAWAGTGWPAMLVLAAAGVYWLPRVLGPDRRAARALARTEAVATWIESVRDALSGGAGLEQALGVTAELAPEPIRQPLAVMRDRLYGGQRLGEALRALAADLHDPVGDLVCAALILAAERHARRLGDLLGALAVTARDQASAQVRVTTSRAQVRTSVRVIVACVLATSVGLMLFSRPFLAPYHSVAGQLVLLAVGGLFAAGIAGLHRLGRLPDAPRLLAPADPTASPEPDREGRP
jgi:tight adherence protein B